MFMETHKSSYNGTSYFMCPLYSNNRLVEHLTRLASPFTTMADIFHNYHTSTRAGSYGPTHSTRSNTCTQDLMADTSEMLTVAT